MKTETSAGGLVVRKDKTNWQVLLVRDMNHSWTFPKGKIEKGETRIAAAVREIGEEVGLHDLTKITSLPALRYSYKRSGSVDKTVYYYIFHYKGVEKPVALKKEGLSQATWVSLPEALERIGYPESNIPLLLKAKEKLGIV